MRDLLLAMARADTSESQVAWHLEQVDEEPLVAAVVRHQMVSLAHERLRAIPSVPRAVIDELGRRRVAAQLLRLHHQRLLATVSGALTGRPWALVKGEALARWYPDSSLREFNDIDVVVAPSDFEHALERFAAADVHLVGANWKGYREYGVAEVPLWCEGTSIDLHWNLVAMGDDRRSIRLSTETLLERAVPLGRSGDDVFTLDPSDTLLHICVNGGLDGARRLRVLTDIDAIVRSGGVDLDEFTSRARQAGAGRLSAAVLQRACLLLGTPVPNSRLTALAGGRLWLAANRRVDASSTVGWRPTGGIASGLLIGSGRDSAPACAAALARSIGRACAPIVGRAGLTQPGGALDWQRRPGGDDVEAHRREYLAWVAASAPL